MAMLITTTHVFLRVSHGGEFFARLNTEGEFRTSDKQIMISILRLLQLRVRIADDSLIDSDCQEIMAAVND